VNCGRTARAAALSARLGQAAADPDRNRQRTGTAWTLRTVITILSNPRYAGRHVRNRQRTDRAPAQDVTAAPGSCPCDRSGDAGHGVPPDNRDVHGDRRSHLPFGMKKIFAERKVALSDDQGQTARTCSACGPFWPCVMSNSTRWFSSRLR
jgi:hypothetical protein